MKCDSKKLLLPSSKVSFIIFFSLPKIKLKIFLMILFYNYQMFPFMFQTIKHISSFLHSLRFYSWFSSKYIVSNFLQICALIVIDSHIVVRDIVEIFIQFLFLDICKSNSLIFLFQILFPVLIQKKQLRLKIQN